MTLATLHFHAATQVVARAQGPFTKKASAEYQEIELAGVGPRQVSDIESNSAGMTP